MNKTDFFIGKDLEVTKQEDDTFNHDFVGTGMSANKGYIQVRDQDDDVWDCNPSQLTEVKVA